MNRKEYEERIAKLEKELKELKEAEITNDEFPKHGQAYWFVHTDGYVVYAHWGDNTIDNYRKDFLRIFRTEEECNRYLEIQEAFMDKSKEFKPDWKNGNLDKYCLYYDHYIQSVKINKWNIHQYSHQFFESREILEELISRFGEEDVKKYYFGIEE